MFLQWVYGGSFRREGVETVHLGDPAVLGEHVEGFSPRVVAEHELREKKIDGIQLQELDEIK